jgi:hypothetical protein
MHCEAELLSPKSNSAAYFDQYGVLYDSLEVTFRCTYCGVLFVLQDRREIILYLEYQIIFPFA